jgi:hypothetical protein
MESRVPFQQQIGLLRVFETRELPQGTLFVVFSERLKTDVRSGSISEVGPRKRNVRFPPVRDRTADIAGGPVRATSGLMRCS